MLVGLRDFQDDKADVLLRYNPDEARNLKTYGELPEEGVARNLSVSHTHTHTHTHTHSRIDGLGQCVMIENYHVSSQV